MKQDLKESITVPEGVTAQYDLETKLLTLKGKKGELSRTLHHPKITIKVEDSVIEFSSLKGTQREKKQLLTFVAHAKNLIKGVTEGFTYELKICSGHFPMSVSIKEKKFEIKNFIGEKVPRRLTIKDSVDVKLEGEKITVSGIDKEAVGQVAGDIECLTRRPGFDVRRFQDGIFIVKKE